MIEAVQIRKTFPATGGSLGRAHVQALRGVTLELPAAGAVCVIGESGSGKTTLGRIFAGLEALEVGELTIDGTRVDTLPERRREPEFRKVQLIHQDPYAALNPTRTIGQTLQAPLRLQAKRLGRDRAWTRERAREVLTLVGLGWRSVLGKYPHALSGGQRQRVVIARALTVDPLALVADEAVSMIDVSLRLGILSLLRDLRSELGISLLFITHDVAAARYVGEEGRMYVLYRGEVIERGATDELIQAPEHPYTQSLLSAVPVLRGLEEPGPDRYVPLRPLEEDGAGPDVCLFSPRCPFATERCRSEHPELRPAGGDDHLRACFHPAPRRVVPVPVATAR